MRPLLLAAALLFPTALAQGVTQPDPTLEDLAHLMGDVAVIEIELPPQARSVRVAYAMGADGGYSEDLTPLQGGNGARARTLRLLLLAPGRLPNPDCVGEPIDLQVQYPDESRSASGFCVPLPDSSSRSKHELVLTGPMPELEAWTPVYLRAWTAIEMGVPGSGVGFDPARTFTIQIWPSAEELENVGDEPPLDAAGLLRIPEIRSRAGPRTDQPR